MILSKHNIKPTKNITNPIEFKVGKFNCSYYEWPENRPLAFSSDVGLWAHFSPIRQRHSRIGEEDYNLKVSSSIYGTTFYSEITEQNIQHHLSQPHILCGVPYNEAVPSLIDADNLHITFVRPLEIHQFQCNIIYCIASDVDLHPFWATCEELTSLMTEPEDMEQIKQEVVETKHSMDKFNATQAKKINFFDSLKEYH